MPGLKVPRNHIPEKKDDVRNSKLAFGAMMGYKPSHFLDANRLEIQMPLVPEDAFTENRVRRVRPNPALLGLSERAEIAGVISQLVTTWSVELSQDTPTTATIVISPDDGEDTSGPTVVISTENGVFRLDAFRWDRYWTIAEYQTWAEAISAIRKVVAWEGAVARTVH